MDGTVTPRDRWHHVVIVGGGASGVLMATHLLASGQPDLRVTVIERGPMLGCGIAYGTAHPDHLLNTRVAQMSAFPDQPDHFADWLARTGRHVTEQCFVDRATYGRYLGDLLTPWRDGADAHRLRCVQGACVALRETATGIIARLDDGTSVLADAAILATGHAVPAEPEPPLRGGWDFSPPEDPDATVAIIGTGLSMVDHVVTLLAAGHRGPILCLSRRGLVPQVHAATRPLKLGRQDIPLGAPVSFVLGWLREKVALAEAAGGTWRDAVDAIRPHIAAIWRAWDNDKRARFLRHAAAYWEVHRHRMPPASAARVNAARTAGQLSLLRGRFAGATVQDDGRLCLRVSAHGRAEAAIMTADRIIDCRGIRRDPVRHAAPVIRDLLARQAARLDPLRLGLDTTRDAQVIDATGWPSSRLFAIGPAARGAWWEITAIPDIREQVFRLARDVFGAGQISALQRA